MDGLSKQWATALLAVAALGACPVCAARTLWFSGMSWTVRPDGVGGPANNNWCENNAFVDANGYLHLKITRSKGKWCAAEVLSDYPLGYGVYQFQVESRLDLLDRNVVLGLFPYPTPDVGPDTTNEIDIEFARWGQAGNGNALNYTVWPVNLSLDPTTKTFALSLDGSGSTHRFVWQPQFVRFQSTHGFYDDNRYPIADWTFAPPDYANRIASKPMPLHMNLWLFNKAPSNGKPVEIIIRQFKFTP